MHFFLDNKNRRWELVVNVPTMTRVKQLLHVDLTQMFKDKCELLVRLSEDFELLVNVLYVLCEKQCTAANVTDEDFGAALVGDPLGNAHEALMQAVIDFFPMSSRREMAQKILGKAKEVDQSLMQCVLKQLDALPGNWQELQARIPTQQPSGN